MEERDEAVGVNVTVPNAARMYDYHLGGAANFEVDRQAIHEILRILPEGSHYARCNRAFLGRAVRYLVTEAGIDQFLDLGSGIPTVGNVHEIAHQHNPHARVAYVDFEPVAVEHARQLLTDETHVTITQADIRKPDQVLAAPGVADLLDFHRPVAVLAVGILPFIPTDTEVQSVMATYRDATPPGSYAAISHISRTSWTEEQIAELLRIMSQTPTPEQHRSPEQIRTLLPGYTLLEPGLVPTPLWRPDDEPDAESVHHSNCYAAVGYLDHPA